MSLQHFFLENQVISHEAQKQFVLKLSSTDLSHIKVLRLRAGEHIALIDAASDYFECEIVSANENEVVVSIAKHLQKNENLPKLTLVQGLCKGSKMDSVVRHATELGVCKFVPFSANRSVLKLDKKRIQTKINRWQTIAKSAAMQAGQTFIPKVLKPKNLQQLSKFLEPYDAVLICWEQADDTCSISNALNSFNNNISKCAEIAVVVGPEGGITCNEVECLQGLKNTKLVSLGRSILRTETAGVVAPALVLYELGAL